MFHARLISLNDEQSYENVEICEDTDLNKFGINKIFEEWTGCFFHDKKCYIVHHWQIKIIHFDREQRGGPRATRIDRLVLDGNIIYAPVTFIHSDDWASLGIPEYFVKQSGITGQMVFSCAEGTFLTYDMNCTSIIMPDPRPSGITSSEQPQQITKASAVSDTVHGRIIDGMG